MTHARMRRTTGRSSVALLTTVMLLAFALRIYRLNYHSIWGDEAFSIYLSKMPLASVVEGGADIHPPFYHIVLHYWMLLFGDSEVAVRFLSTFIGVLTVAVALALGRRIVGLKAAVLGTIVLSVAPFHIYYSQETRMYGLVTLLGILSQYFLCSAVAQAESSPSDGRRPLLTWLAYFLTTLLAVYTHYYAFFLLVAQGIWVVLCHRRRPLLSRWLLSQAVLVLCYLPWLAVQMNTFTSRAGAGGLHLTSLGKILQESLRAFSVGTTLASPVDHLLSSGFLLLTAAGLLALFSRRHLLRRGISLALCIVIPLILAWLAHPLMLSFHARYLLLCAPFFSLLVGLGLALAAERRVPIFAVGLLFLLGASSYSLRGYYFDKSYAKGGYRSLMEYVRLHSLPEDALLLDNPAQAPIYQYYGPDDVASYFFPKDYPLEDQRTTRELEWIAARHSRLWLVMFGDPAEYDPNHFLEHWLGQRAYKSFYQGFLDAGLALYLVSSPVAEEPMLHPMDANLDNKVILQAYTVNSTTATPGANICLTLYWQCIAKMDAPYTVFAHLVDASGRRWAQMDSQPAGNTHPTTHWIEGEVVADNYGLLISPQTPTGEYTLEVGMYLLSSMERLPVLDAAGNEVDTRICLGKIKVIRE